MKTKLFIIGAISLLSITSKAQKMIEITKSVVIEGSKEEVFNKVLHLSEFPDWSPFLEMDPTQKCEVKGEDGKVGSQYHWNGNKGKDQGYQELVEAKDQKFIRMNCDISKPYEAKPTFDYPFNETPLGIMVTQDFKLEVSGASSFFMGLFGVKKKMAKMNARGLELLKQSIESRKN